MTTGQAFIDFSRFCNDRLQAVVPNVDIDGNGNLATPYFYLQQGPEDFGGGRLMASMFVLGRLVVAKEANRTLADTAAYYKDTVRRLLTQDQGEMLEKFQRRDVGSAVSSGHYYFYLRSITADLSEVDDKAEHVFTFEIRTSG